MKLVTPKGRYLGRKPDAPDPEDRKFLAVHPDAAHIPLPPSVDLRHFRPMPDAFDQGELGSCGANAGSGLMCFLFPEMAAGGFSRLQIYYDVRKLENSVDEDSGVQTRDVLKTLKLTGAAPEGSWPYDVTMFTQRPPASVYAEAGKHKLKSYSRLVSGSNYLQCIASGFPFVLGVELYESFESEQTERTGIMPIPGRNEKVIGGHDILCLTGDTEIPLLNGKTVPIAELAETHAQKSFWVYSCDGEKHIVPGLAHSPRKTGRKKIVAVELDNGQIIRCTANHPFMMRDGSYRDAGALMPRDSLMPLYRKSSTKGEMLGYEMLRDPQSGRWQYTHRAVAAFNAQGRYEGVVHHIDFDKLNNDPANLQVMTWDEHTRLHANQTDLLSDYAKSEHGRARSKSLMDKLWADPAWREKQIKKLRQFGIENSRKLVGSGQFGTRPMDPERHRELARKSGPKNLVHAHTPAARERARVALKLKFNSDDQYRTEVKDRARRNLAAYNEGIKNGSIMPTAAQIAARKKNATVALAARMAKTVINHKVLSVTDAGEADVYDLTVDEHHNFALSAGVFVHNCVGYVLNFKSDPLFKKSGLDAALVADEMLIIRNSWGPKWGRPFRGHCFMPLPYALDNVTGNDAWTGRRV
jgi:hypothetical protein